MGKSGGWSRGGIQATDSDSLSPYPELPKARPSPKAHNDSQGRRPRRQRREARHKPSPNAVATRWRKHAAGSHREPEGDKQEEAVRGAERW
eukprot:CAMPEP_0174324726 /NCGR_PEP_ID=MMETSP0810-20121108/12698_1 /TAXON_ID=73025 ORGANISM="Eutreptiella gymnastica-like, Strain CCMP1594" /NCGR_SAMPLE_ID=MMETSP0810 /ASSEMBLY_ACC=CAM_ASM_000659 /LENGTH=90 /DNA_ID=CAMNT_0015437647 /DNA_START=1272 /DNA_END=1541 /DNA_ORIENTATION=+